MVVRRDALNEVALRWFVLLRPILLRPILLLLALILLSTPTGLQAQQPGSAQGSPEPAQDEAVDAEYNHEFAQRDFHDFWSDKPIILNIIDRGTLFNYCQR